MRHLAPAETQRRLDLHVFAKEADGMVQLDAKIVRVNRRTKLDFLNFVGVLMFPGFLFLL